MLFKKLIIACIAISAYSAIEIHDADGVRTLSISEDKSPYVFESCDKICITNESERPISMTLHSMTLHEDYIKQCEFKGKFHFLSLVMLQAEKILFLDDSKCNNCVIKQGDEKIHHIIENPAVKFTYIQHADIHENYDAIHAISHLHSKYCHHMDSKNPPHINKFAPLPNFTNWMHIIINKEIMPMIKEIEAIISGRITELNERISNLDANQESTATILLTREFRDSHITLQKDTLESKENIVTMINESNEMSINDIIKIHKALNIQESKSILFIELDKSDESDEFGSDIDSQLRV